MNNVKINKWNCTENVHKIMVLNYLRRKTSYVYGNIMLQYLWLDDLIILFGSRNVKTLLLIFRNLTAES